MDEYGFSALPGGYYRSDSDVFGNVGSTSHWWSATEGNVSAAISADVNYDNEYMYTWNGRLKMDLYSVRCAQD